MVIGGFQKLSLVDYPGFLACIIFTKGCNFDCQYCHNSELLCNSEPSISEDEIFDYLRKRKGYIEGVVITGGEPTIQKDLKSFIKKIKDLGYKIKLDTNGFKPEIVNEFINEKLVDYIAMDIKASLNKYSLVVNKNYNFNKILESINIIDKSNIPHEFRITLFKPLLNIEDLMDIVKLIKDDTPFYIQNFRQVETVRDKNLFSYEEKELKEILTTLLNYHTKTFLR